jgi:dipeptidyl aminopeptidase/acylaminoacyl peptidase
MRRLLVCIFTFLLSASCLAQGKHPFTFEDMMALKRVGEPVPSPDGKWVLFSAVDVNLDANTKTPHVWIVPLAGGESREIISDQDADRPRWAPDGKRFLFVSSKEGGSQVWIADFDGSAGTVTGRHKLTSIATGADGPIWSPDGKNIAFTSRVYPECADEACNKKKTGDVANSKVKALIFTRLLYRHWNAFQAGKRSHIFVIPVDACVGTAAPGCPAGAPRDLTPGDYDVPPFHLAGRDDYAFSPDGQEICYTSNHDKIEAASTNNDLFIVPVNVGTGVSPVQTKNITAENKAADETPLYSPDGKYIAYRAQTRPGYESDRWRLMLYDRKTSEKKNLTEEFDAWVGTYVWSQDSKHVYFVYENAGGAPFRSIVVDQPFKTEELSAPDVKRGFIGYEPLSGTGLLVLGFDYNDDLALASDGNTLLFTHMSIRAPNEIYKIAINKVPSQEEALTHLNDAVLSQVSMSPLESFWFTGANNDKVQGFLVKPPNFDPSKKYPVKFLIHGGPQGAWGDDWSYRWNPELFAANGYVVVMINFHGSTGYGQKFIDAINGDWGGAPFEDVMKGLDYAEQHYPFIDKDRECALGASYGGYMVNWILGHTNRFKCIVSHDGMFNTESAWGTTEELWFNEWEFKGTPYTNRALYEKWSPHLSATNFKTPTLVVHGQLDYRLDVSEGYQLFTTLQRLNIPSKMLYFPDEGHWVLKPQNSRLWYQTVNDWVDQWLKK